VFPHRNGFGRIFVNMAPIWAAAIPQLAVVHGAAAPLGGPPAVSAATGEEVTAEEPGGADVHARDFGLVDYVAESEIEALALAWQIALDWRLSTRAPRVVRDPLPVPPFGRYGVFRM